MQHRPSSSHALTIAIALAAGAFVACAAPKPAATTLTAAEVPRAEEREASPTAAAERPAGQLVCKTKNSLEGTSELYLEWNGDAAKGTLRRTAPSGSVTSQPVKAERYKDMIVADEPGSMDLVEHAATVATRDGKHYIRLGGYKGGWTACD